MKDSLKIGIGFGVTSAMITTLGLIVGLSAGTHSRVAVAGGIIMIAIADAFSDALGIHISEESTNSRTSRQVWTSTLATFGAKFFLALTFLIPVMLLPLLPAVIISFGWGFLMLSMLSIFIARSQRQAAWKIVAEHISIAVLVIVITYFAGVLVHNYVY